VNKRPQYLIVAVLCSIIAAATATTVLSGQSGMAVWGDVLAIHSSDTLLAQGDLYLFNANVSGNGALLLQDTAPRSITAHNSSLPHLIIHNTDTVALHGDLYIRCGLTLAQGVFDTRAGKLKLADSAFTHILPGSHWLQEQNKTAYYGPPLFSQWPPTAQQALLIADRTPFIHTRLAVLPPWQLRSAFFFANVWPAQVWLSTPSPPPQPGAGFAVVA